MKRRVDIAKESRRRSREAGAQPPPRRVREDKRRKKPRHRDRALDNAGYDIVTGNYPESMGDVLLH